MGRPKLTVAQFWEKVNKDGPIPDASKNCVGPCWEWKQARSYQGYGVSTINRVYTAAHRAAWIHTHGSIPEGLQVLHKCDNPPCCNPDHLWVGTHSDNMTDRDKKNRQSQGDKHHDALMPNRPRGEGHYASKITKEQAIEMRRLYTETKMPMKEIAAKFGLSYGTASKLMRGDTWKCLGEVQQPKKRAAKLSEETVREIRRLRSSMTIKQLAHQFLLPIFTINDIVYRRTWRDLPDVASAEAPATAPEISGFA